MPKKTFQIENSSPGFMAPLLAVSMGDSEMWKYYKLLLQDLDGKM